MRFKCIKMYKNVLKITGCFKQFCQDTYKTKYFVGSTLVVLVPAEVANAPDDSWRMLLEKASC